MPTTVAHVIGARPNFMKAAPVIEALTDLGVSRHVIHTGQHYDERMSDIFFRQLGLPEPDVNLGVGSGSHAAQTARLLERLEGAIESSDPAAVVVYGDVNSTIAAALVCAKLGRPLVHVEAGLRSFDWTMPEEVNRRITDVCADLLLVTSPEAIGYLGREGVEIERIRFVGNPMIDSLLRHRPLLDPARVRDQLGLPEDYVVTTLHRPSNVDGPGTAAEVVAALRQVGGKVPVVFPLHPRGRDTLAAAGLVDDEQTRVVEPLGYLEFLALVDAARLVITDSGGVQEETTMLDVPCLTVRPNTERPITITHGTNRLVEPSELAAEAVKILDGAVRFPAQRPPLWDGQAGLRCAQEIQSLLNQR